MNRSEITRKLKLLLHNNEEEKMKKIFALFLVMIMVFAFMAPVTVSAATTASWIATECQSGFYTDNYISLPADSKWTYIEVTLTSITANRTIGIQLSTSRSSSGLFGEKIKVSKTGTYTCQLSYPDENFKQIYLRITNETGGGTNIETKGSWTGYYSSTATPSISVSPTSRSFTSSGGSGTHTVTTNQSNWSIDIWSLPPWLSYTTSGSTLTLTATANTETSSRYADIILKAGSASCSIYVTQTGAAAYLDFSPTWWMADADVNRTYATVDSNVSWTASSDASWLTVSPSNGSGNGNLTIDTKANPSTEQRNGTITVTGGGISRKMSVTQFGVAAYLDLSLASWSLPASAASVSVMVTSNVSWNAYSSDTSWLTVSPSNGSGNGNLTIGIKANPYTASRSGTITVSGGGISGQIWVEQEGAYTYPVTYDANGGMGAPGGQTKIEGVNLILSGIIPARTGYTFQGWATYYGVSYQPGDIYTYDAPCELYAEWIPNNYTVTLNPDGGSGGTTSVTATYDSGMPAPISLPTKAGCAFDGYWDALSGGTQYYTSAGASARNWDKPSNATLYARWTADFYLDLSQYSWSAPANMGDLTVLPNLTVAVSSNVNWTAASNAPGWIDVSPSGGTDNGSISINLTYNTVSSPRVGKVIVSGGGITREIVVTQAGADIVVYFNGNENTGGFPPSRIVGSVGSVVKLPAQGTLVKTGYSFGGWNTNSAGTGVNYLPGYPFMIPDKSVMLYARWTTSAYKITANPPIPGLPAEASPGNVVTIKPPAGYVFDTVSITRNDNGQSIPLNGSDFIMPDSDVTITTTFIINSDALTFALGSDTNKAGEVVEVPVMISNNGINDRGVAAINGLKIQFDNTYLEWAGTAAQSIVTGGLLDYATPQGANFSSGHAVITFDSEFGTKLNGTLVTLKFKIKADAPAGGIALNLTIGSVGDDSLMVAAIPASEYNVVSGKITVVDTLCGDVNGDGVVDMLDSILLSRYVADWGNAINLMAADVNGDGVVDMLDAIILSRHTAEWPGYEVLPWKPGLASQEI